MKPSTLKATTTLFRHWTNLKRTAECLPSPPLPRMLIFPGKSKRASALITVFL